MLKDFSISTKALEASNAVSLLVAKSKKPHKIAESLILPAFVAIVEIILDKKAVDTIRKVPLSNDTYERFVEFECRLTLNYCIFQKKFVELIPWVH